MLFSPVDQNRELNSFRSTKIHQLVQSGPDGPAGVENVIDQYNAFSFDVFGEFGTIDYRIGSDGGKVVSVKCDVDDAVERLRAFESLDLIAEPLGKRDTSAAYPDQINICRTVICFDDLRRQSRKSPLHAGFVHYSRFLNESCFVSHSSRNRSKPRLNIKISGRCFRKDGG